ncbi:MAG: hypothetical protein IJZ85_12205 [Lachnospiraceae bacterium]|nr:hypothetical protein [Lachnospiraceae bacterium]
MRKDGVKIKNANPMYLVMNQFLRYRYDAMNQLTLDIPIEPMQKYIRAKKAEGIRLSHMGLVIAAYVRTLAEFPQLNRFVMNGNIYARNEIAVGMVVLKTGQMIDETFSKMYFLPEDDIFTVQKIIDEFLESNKKAEESNGTDRIIEILVGIPGLLKFGCAVLRWMDKHNLLPKAIIDVSPFHSSMVVTNLASIRTPHLYHHIYDFGTVGEFMAMGNFREVPKTLAGETKFVTCMPIGYVMDERICTGAYCSMALQRFKGYLTHPERMEGAPKVLNYDDGVVITKRKS